MVANRVQEIATQTNTVLPATATPIQTGIFSIPIQPNQRSGHGVEQFSVRKWDAFDSLAARFAF